MKPITGSEEILNLRNKLLSAEANRLSGVKTYTIAEVSERLRSIPLAERLEGWNGQSYELTSEDKIWLDIESMGE